MKIYPVIAQAYDNIIIASCDNIELAKYIVEKLSKKDPNGEYSFYESQVVSSKEEFINSYYGNNKLKLVKA